MNFAEAFLAGLEHERIFPVKESLLSPKLCGADQRDVGVVPAGGIRPSCLP